jgi:glucuronoarabinoxylan endo-1,4-beta-xylanase
MTFVMSVSGSSTGTTTTTTTTTTAAATTTTTTTGRTTTTTTVTTTPNSGGTGARVTYTINAWNTGFTASISITNTGSTPIDGWALGFTLPSGQALTSGWNASFSTSGGAVTARNASYNGVIAPGATVDLGFQGTHTGNTAEPTAFTLNGIPCTVA